MDRPIVRWSNTLIVMRVAAVMVLALGQAVFSIPAYASTNFATTLCGDGSTPDYGFTYTLQQPHWTVGWQDYASEQAVTEVDVILDRLNADFIAQTMILIQPQEKVGNRVNCAVHFLRYMQLGQPTGERKDNGFVFLIVVEPDRIDVHYGVGLGLPALTASELTTLNRTAEAAYQSTQNFDQALLTLVQGFDTVARNNYAPLIAPTPASETVNLPTLPAGPVGIFTICGLLCLGILILPILVWGLRQLSRTGTGNGFNPIGSRPRRMGNPFGGGGSRSRPPTTRGGSGSGRSGRGN